MQTYMKPYILRAGAIAGVIAHVVKWIADLIVGLVLNTAFSSDPG